MFLEEKPVVIPLIAQAGPSGSAFVIVDSMKPMTDESNGQTVIALQHSKKSILLRLLYSL